MKPVRFKQHQRPLRASIWCNSAALVAVVAILQVSASTASAQFVISQSGEFLAFEAEQYDSLELGFGSGNPGDEATRWLPVAQSDMLRPLGDMGEELDLVLLNPEDPDFANAVGLDEPAVMFDQEENSGDLIRYKLSFSDPGIYYFYARYSEYDMNGDGTYGNEDSVFYPRDWGMDPTGPLSDFNFWGYTPNGTPAIPAGQEGQPREGNYMWIRGADNSANSVAWEYEVEQSEVGVVLDWGVAARENGIAMDRFVFSTRDDLSAEELNEIPSFVPIPPGCDAR